MSSTQTALIVFTWPNPLFKVEYIENAYKLHQISADNGSSESKFFTSKESFLNFIQGNSRYYNNALKDAVAAIQSFVEPTVTPSWKEVSWIDAALAFDKKTHKVEYWSLTLKEWLANGVAFDSRSRYRICEEMQKVSVTIPAPSSVMKANHYSELILNFYSKENRDKAYEEFLKRSYN